MKCWLLIIISFFAMNLTQIAESVGEGGQESKLYKTFDEIFGKGWDDESNDSKNLNCRHVKEEVQDGQAPITSDQKNIDEILKQKFDEIFYDENWSEDEKNSEPLADVLDQKNSKKHLSDKNNSTDQDESVDEQQQNECNKCENIVSDQQKWEIIQKFCKMKEDYKKKNRKYSRNEWNQIESKISNSLGVGRTTLYKWKREFGLSVSNKISDATKIGILKKYAKIKGKNPKMSDCDIVDLLKISRSSLTKWKAQFSKEIMRKCTDLFSEFEKQEILKQFEKIKSKCKKAKIKSGSKHELDEKIGTKLGVSRATIIRWKQKFGLSVSNKISDATKIGILKKYGKIKRKNPKMTDAIIAEMLNISTGSLSNWKKQFKE